MRAVTNATLAALRSRQQWSERRAQAVFALVLAARLVLAVLVLTALLTRWTAIFLAESAVAVELQCCAKSGVTPLGTLAAQQLVLDFRTAGSFFAPGDRNGASS